MPSLNILDNHFDLVQSVKKEIVAIIKESVTPERIYLIGASLYNKQTESIFDNLSASPVYLADYYLLVVVKDGLGRRMSDWEDMLEARCASICQVTIIVVVLAKFLRMYSEGNLLVTLAHQANEIFYDSGNIHLHDLNTENKHPLPVLQKDISKSVHRAKEFLAAADMYISRKEPELATLMIHQCLEQIFRVLILRGFGIANETHNIDKMFRCVVLLDHQWSSIFPIGEGDSKKLLGYLQHSYYGARYRHKFNLTIEIATKLKGKAQLALDLLLKTIKVEELENNES
ncbi:HEPN domain-containing protein [Chitinophaga pendula]|uniref:HEPN domain-containing protein n=1 Tax=Chitinophaga TaxID=79328 RepID=UPI000BB0937D|nr:MULTISPECIES: HEPN domain-containing protein [Chitinophaga]ASZ13727.1 hypothetical protein CK934_23610 [Chitinophaga sp. MD30]UCJ08654.1 HEPN domain-containing protein [Chitinophaga pendula]